ncbi:unnamed protein product [Rhizoctonia solani]|uniref:Uncharacterized protein n=1 Tax=Rhizoctonia solani TaxID=456999 RepID=A0A8H3CTZ8_9AGAM|nr:unnamed protein product [Rhizoctonia solani]
MDPEGTVNEANQACVTISPEMQNANRVFHCPRCLSEGEPRKIDYVINRGARMTMRLASKTSLALIVYYLQSLKDSAEALTQQLQSSLAALEVNVALTMNILTSTMHEAEASEIHEQLSRDDPYHLAVIFITESQPGGGWWYTSEKDRRGKVQISEQTLLESCLGDLRPLAESAITARVFGVACGMNLPGEGVIKEIHDYLYPRPYLSILLPSVYSLTVPDYTNILPELFVHLYYFGAPFRASILRVWAVDREARAHTGIVLMDRTDCKHAFRVSKFIHSPTNRRPFGVDLPEPTTVCGCQDYDARWKVVKRMDGFQDEKVVILKLTCCQTQLQVAIKPGQRQELTMHGTTVTEEVWNIESMSFEFNEFDMVAMRTSSPQVSVNPNPALHAPWTHAGRKAQNN